ncbi:MAG: adenylate/guanylate cyclase domain-containing protein [Salinivirgaceae bacterium]|jgi:adenylate cyclase|nr:adenylate/guanylate cyclase domain-containing protein [Salinivirgaceae bacterium]
MFSKERLTIRFNRLFRNFMFHFVFWYASMLFYAFLTGENQIFKVYLNFLRTDNIYVVILFLAIFASIIFTLIDRVFTYQVQRFFPRYFIGFFKSVLFFASAFILILIAARLPITIYTEKNYLEIFKTLPELDIHFFRFLVYFYISGFVVTFLNEVIKAIGRSNFRHWVFGMLSKPMEQERIFMFIDMKKSTTIAEQLGHKKFSHLVQDVFNDLAVVDNYNGQIYQYLGDGAIISWNLKQGLKRANCIRSFYAFIQLINKRKRYYNRRYGLIPTFKAGAHSGKVMVLQVGQIRRDISYNGDTINTTARIESVCNDYKQNFLISGNLAALLPESKEF